MSSQDQINSAMKTMRAASFAESPQITLGDTIKLLEEIPASKDAYVEFDFCGLKPLGIHSWRGAFDELALGYTDDGDYDSIRLSKFLEELKQAIGKTYIGYKGGYFTMTKDAPLWVANYSYSDNTGVVGVHAINDTNEDAYHVIILTAFCEY